MHLIVRETTAEAWADADRLIKYADDKTIAAAQKRCRSTIRSVRSGCAVCTLAVARNSKSAPICGQGWGYCGAEPGPLVGDAATVAERMNEYAELGIDTFICSGYPHLEEAYRVAELLFPLLPLTHGTRAESDAAPSAAGEILGNRYVPTRARAENQVAG